MCLSQPKVNTATTTVTKADTTSNEDAVANQLEQEKKRRGFQSTIASKNVSSVAPTAKVTLGS
ncbi:MAG: hypothetical protein H6Q72_953 [Firmicutes bacterium]|nr:hypothetical protein [Bacillota bacterium]